MSGEVPQLCIKPLDGFLMEGRVFTPTIASQLLAELTPGMTPFHSTLFVGRLSVCWKGRYRKRHLLSVALRDLGLVGIEQCGILIGIHKIKERKGRRIGHVLKWIGGRGINEWELLLCRRIWCGRERTQKFWK